MLEVPSPRGAHARVLADTAAYEPVERFGQHFTSLVFL
jgi:hypothetical protein